jgi:copper chaperone
MESKLVTFEVQDMTCGHCVSSITKAVLAIDPGAKVITDLGTHRVQIEPTESDSAQLSAAIREAGYTPARVEDGAVATEQPPARSGCCCR